METTMRETDDAVKVIARVLRNQHGMSREAAEAIATIGLDRIRQVVTATAEDDRPALH
jgi:hypothetical protein